MKLLGCFAEKKVIAVLGVAAALTPVRAVPEEKSIAQDRAAIERLHREDVEATLSGKADDFRKLWDEEAVRLEPGGEAEVGRSLIYADDKRQETKNPGAQILSYQPMINDLKIVDGWAFEWGYFEGTFKESATAKPVPMRGKLLRVLKRQADGSWKFVRVMWNEANRASSEPAPTDAHP